MLYFFHFPYYNALKCNICFSRMEKRSTSQVKIMLVMLAAQKLCLTISFLFLGGGGCEGGVGGGVVVES
jgi:hypothetical protein